MLVTILIAAMAVETTPTLRYVALYPATAIRADDEYRRIGHHHNHALDHDNRSRNDEPMSEWRVIIVALTAYGDGHLLVPPILIFSGFPRWPFLVFFTCP